CWLTLSWPREYGGQERSHIEQLIFEEELGRALAPMGGASNHGPRFVGPAIMHYGTPEQKRRFLPPIARGETIWSQCFTEPNAGRLSAGYRDAVRVPRRDLLGEKDRGWYQMLAVMNYERSNIRLVAQLQRWAEILIRYARGTEIDGIPLAADPITQHRLAQLL